ncbi:cadmium-translocating P-type ATPase [Candidatus Kaiserbacteria bacterium]|nr:cadmium-translocating P-type ATPase [Candidatus Kaiserbacteria bacterium]
MHEHGHTHHQHDVGSSVSRDAGVDKHAGHHTADFLKKFWVVLTLTIPIIAYSDLPMLFFGWMAPAFSGSAYLSLVLGSVIFFYGGLVFLRGAVSELRARLPGMMTLIALAITTAYLYSVVTVFVGGMSLFWELSTLIAVMLLGHWIEMRAVMGASGALNALAKLLPDTADVVREGATQTISVSALRSGDIVIVRPGGKIPADGEVIEGRSEIDESMLTGESKPVPKDIGAVVVAGSINGDGTLRIRVSHIGESTFLAGIMRLVAEAQSSKSRLQMLSDRAAFWLTMLAVGAGAITFVAWIFAQAGVGFATERLVAVLVIACPHALGLAIPLVAAISTTMAARNGLLIKKRIALEAARKVTVVVFDKTGTLTQGRFAVTDSSSDDALALAASVEAGSEHSIGKAILEEARRRKLDIRESQDFRRIPGVGAEALVDGARVFVGHRGNESIRVEVAGKEIGTIKVADTIRPEARDAVRSLKAMGLKIVMITGDAEDAARVVAQELGIDQYFARVLPGQKADKVLLLQKEGATVAMVGDGVNDAPALAQADLGIAIGAGTNVAIESAGIILVRSDPRDIAKVIRLSRLTYTKMIQNLFWASAYNVIALPIAAGALFSWGIILQPAVAAIFMSASTVIVAVNASLLGRKSLSE